MALLHCHPAALVGPRERAQVGHGASCGQAGLPLHSPCPRRQRRFAEQASQLGHLAWLCEVERWYLSRLQPLDPLPHFHEAQRRCEASSKTAALLVCFGSDLILCDTVAAIDREELLQRELTVAVALAPEAK